MTGAAVFCKGRHFRSSMGIALGIDTGGTYTDAVFVTYPEGCVIAGAQALTNR